MHRVVTVLLLAALEASTAHAADSVVQRQLTLDGAKRAVAAAVAYARKNNAPGGAIAVVDSGGHVILVERLDGTFAAGAAISIGKARTAVMFKRPTRGIEDIINKGRTAMVPVAEVTWFTPLQGGVPLMIDNEIVGGIGVSGAASAQQDEEVAIAGAQAVGSEKGAEVHYVPADQVAAAYRRGESGDTVVSGDLYRVNASRRDAAGEAEIHLTEVDIFYVLDGQATFVTGGELLEPRDLTPSEIRGSAIRGGTERQLARGDVITVPAGVPHWFKQVTAPFRYYVVKSGEQGG
ncbi:MAG TPA: heme-binding protein [Steroidobacteraceae bacterium]|nr:heme-binding protein [Steroidobacteraceae bacterium]